MDFRVFAARVLPGALVALVLGLPASPAAERVYASPEQVEPLQPGGRVPAATLHSVRGEPVELSALVRERGATLVFYRGGW